MKFVKGIVIGSMIGAGAILMYTEGMVNKKKIKQFAKKMNLM